MSKRFKIAACILIICIAVLCDVAFLGIVSSSFQPQINQINSSNKQLFYKLDSLENVINTNLINRKDTILIHVIPQEIKIYNSK